MIMSAKGGRGECGQLLLLKLVALSGDKSTRRLPVIRSKIEILSDPFQVV